MQIPKDKVLDMIQQQGDSGQAEPAKQELPDPVDTDQHTDLLHKYGLNPYDVISKLGSDTPSL